MNNTLPNISYERNMNHNYMILSSCDFFGNGIDNNDFRKKMLLENNIPGLLPVKCRHVNGETKYCYEINSLQSIDRLYNKKELDYSELQNILMGCIKLFGGLEEYLLDGSQIILAPEYVYMDIDRMELYFVCYPEYEGDVREAFTEFIDMLLTKIDHTDNDAVMLGYRVYRYTKNPNYVMSEIANLIEASKPEEEKYNIPEAIISQQPLYFNESEEEEVIEPKSKSKSKVKSGDVIGIIFSILIAIVTTALIVMADITPSMAVVRNNEIYLYGAIAMSLAGALLFAISHSKKKKLEKAKEALSDEEDEHSTINSTAINNGAIYRTIPQSPRKQSIEPLGTICLNESSTEERILIGRVNGKEVTIPLTKFPIILGKQEGVSDIIVDDNAVSKMHARFDELDGRIFISDLNSTNGTVRNGTMLDMNHPVVLEPGDRLRFGRSSFTYC
jgi:hypothetical protein